MSKSGKIEIVTTAESAAPIKVEVASTLSTHLSNKVSISLRYYQKKPECWSEWKEKELKGFTKVIDLLRQQTSDQIKSRGKAGSPVCRIHAGSPSTSGFNRPTEISEDIAFHEMYATDKARLHGFFVEDVFFLVWLDRSHRAFP